MTKIFVFMILFFESRSSSVEYYGDDKESETGRKKHINKYSTRSAPSRPSGRIHDLRNRNDLRDSSKLLLDSCDNGLDI